MCVATALSSRAEDYTGSPYELTADLTVTADDTVSANMAFDTKGHTLTLAPEHFGGSTYFIVRSTVAGGVLKVVVPDGVTITNKNVELGGATNLQLHKYGAGKLVMERANTGFGGLKDGSAMTSIVVYDGIVKKAKLNYRASCGAQWSFIEVKDGGQFDIGGRTYSDYSYKFEGDGPKGASVPGALVNTDETSSWWETKNPSYLCGMYLTGNATVGGTASWVQSFYYAALRDIVMNGHVLTYKGNLVASGNRRFVGNGDIVIASGQFQCFTMSYSDNIASTGVIDTSASNCTFTVQNDALYAQHDYAVSPVRTLVFTEGAMFRNIYATYPTTVVYERYAPNLIASPSGNTPSAPHPKVQLGDTSHLVTTLDLSLWSSPFNAVTNGLTLTTFQTGSSVTVDVGSRPLSVGEKLIGWNSVPGATFGLSSSDDTKDVVAREDGLYVKTISPAYATLDTSATPNAWRFFKADGTPYPGWTDGVTGDMEVRITSYDEYVAIRAMDGLAPASFLMTGTIAIPSGEGVCDLSDCSYDFADGDLAFDANGRQVKLPNSMVGGIKAFSVTSSVADGVLIVDVGSGATVVNSHMTLSGGANLQLWKTGAGTLVMDKANSGFGAVERDSVVVKAGVVRKTSASNVATCGAA